MSLKYFFGLFLLMFLCLTADAQFKSRFPLTSEKAIVPDNFFGTWKVETTQSSEEGYTVKKTIGSVIITKKDPYTFEMQTFLHEKDQYYASELFEGFISSLDGLLFLNLSPLNLITEEELLEESNIKSRKNVLHKIHLNHLDLEFASSDSALFKSKNWSRIRRPDLNIQKYVLNNSIQEKVKSTLNEPEYSEPDYTIQKINLEKNIFQVVNIVELPRSFKSQIELYNYFKDNMNNSFFYKRSASMSDIFASLLIGSESGLTGEMTMTKY